MEIKDNRGIKERAEANAHTELLEDIIAKNQKKTTWNGVKKWTKKCFGLAKIMGAGYLAGYVVSGGDTDAGIQLAEYGAVFWMGLKLGVEWPIQKLVRRAGKDIEEKIKGEERIAWVDELTGRFHLYKPKYGIDFTNYPTNYDNIVENIIQSSYWGNLEMVRKPVHRTISNLIYGAATGLVCSLIVDMEVNIIDVLGPNLIEKGLDLTHYALVHTPLKVNFSEAHAHLGDFNQINMMYMGLAIGAIASGEELIGGCYQRLRAILKVKKE